MGFSPFKLKGDQDIWLRCVSSFIKGLLSNFAELYSVILAMK